MTSEQASVPSPCAAWYADETHLSDTESKTERVDRARAAGARKHLGRASAVARHRDARAWGPDAGTTP